MPQIEKLGEIVVVRDQCVKRKRSTTAAVLKYQRHSSGDIPSLTNEMSTGVELDGSTNSRSYDVIGEAVVSVRSLLECVSDATKKLNEHVVVDSGTTLRPSSDNPVAPPDLSVLPKDVLVQQLQPIVTLLKKLRIEAVLPSLQPVEETVEETAENENVTSAKASLGDGYVDFFLSLLVPYLSHDSSRVFDSISITINCAFLLAN